MLRHRLLVWLSISFVFCLSSVLAQKPVESVPAVEFGKITPDQFAFFSKDTTAEAIVLYESGDVSFEVNVDESWIVFTHHVRTLIRRKSAYDRATVQLTVRRGVGTLNEKMSELEGRTYNLVNGRVVADQLDLKTAHFTEKAAESYWIEKFTMPNVREGSVIEYNYTIRTPFNVNRSPQAWRFQRDIPVDWSQYHIILPNRYLHKPILGGSLKLTVEDVKATKISLIPGRIRSDSQESFYAIKNVPAFQRESYIATEEDYISKIDFEPPNYYDLYANTSVEFAFSWEAVDKRLQANKSFGIQITPTDWIRKQAEVVADNQLDTLSRVLAIYNFVRRTMTWNGGFSIWSGDLKKVLTDKKGDSGDINLLLIAMMRSINIDAYPVILSTRSHGLITEDLALLRKFNYVIAQVTVGGKTLLLDATDPYLKLGMLPTHCLNGIGRLIDPPNSRFVSLAPKERLTSVETAQFTLDETGELSGTLAHSFGGYAAWINHKLFAVAGKTTYVDAIHKAHSDWQIKDVTFTGASQPEDVFGADYNLVIADVCTRAGDRLYFKPMLTEARSENPFKAPYRQYPIDFTFPIDEAFTATYTLPKDFRVEELPKPISMTLPGDGGRFLYQVSVDGNQLRVNSRIILRKPIYTPDEYPALRELFTQIVTKHAEQVVLKKVETVKK
jgi:hypothetical protein